MEDKTTNKHSCGQNVNLSYDKFETNPQQSPFEFGAALVALSLAGLWALAYVWLTFYIPNEHIFCLLGDPMTLYYNVVYHGYLRPKPFSSMSYPDGDCLSDRCPGRGCRSYQLPSGYGF